MIRDFLQNARAAARRWLRRPALLVVAVATLAGGLGAATGVFSVAYAVLWRPFDIPAAERLVIVRSVESGAAGLSSPGAALAWQAGTRTVEQMALIWRRSAVVADGRSSERVAGAFVSPELLPVLGITATAGRALTSSDVVDPPSAVVLSESYWSTRFGRRADAVGGPVSLNGRPHTVVGILSASAEDVLGDLQWLAPLRLAPAQADNFGPRYLEVVARVRDGYDASAVQAELQALTGSRSRGSDGAPLTVAVHRFVDERVAAYRDVLLLLQASVLLLLLIACGNVGSLLLGDALDRRRELALRASLGARRAQLARQLLAEVLVLVGVAAAGALVVAQWVTDVLRTSLPGEMPRLQRAGIDGMTFLFVAAAAMVVAVCCAVAPLLRGLRFDVVEGLAGIDPRAGRRDDRWRRGFVVAQIALTVVLALAAGLVVRSVDRLEKAPRGYEADHLVTASIGIPARYDDGRAIAGMVLRVRAALAAMPGARDVALASRVPLGGETVGSDLELVERPFTQGVDRQVRIRLADRGFFAASGTPIVAGRDIADADHAGAPPVVVLNETLARRLLAAAGAPAGGGDPAHLVGRAVKFAVPAFNRGAAVRPWTVIGIVADSFDRGPRAPVQPEVSIPIAQAPDDVFEWMNRQLAVAVRSEAGNDEVAAQVRRAVAGVDAAIPVSDIMPMRDRLRLQFAREQVASRLLVTLGVAGLALSALGLFAVMSHRVRRREREIAVRLALGGRPRDVLAWLLRDGLSLALTGLVVGLAGGVGAGGALQSLLFEVRPLDPMALGVVSITVLAGAAGVIWWPARRGARADLTATLRAQ